MKKKSLVIASSAAFAALAMVGIGTNLGGGNIANVIGEDAPCEHVGNHYAAIAAGDYTPGVKEYYACCKCHERFVVSPETVSYSIEDGTVSGSHTCPGSLYGTTPHVTESGNTFSYWDNGCGYIKFGTPIAISGSAKLEISVTFSGSDLYNYTGQTGNYAYISFYRNPAPGDWGSGRIDVAAEYSSSGVTSTLTLDETQTATLVSSNQIPGVFLSSVMATSWNGSGFSGKGASVTVNSVIVYKNSKPTGTWTDATLPEDVKNAILADSTDSRYAQGLLGTKSAVSSYTCADGTSTGDSRTCPNGLNGTAQWGISGYQLGFWANDCGYVKFATPLTVTTGSKLEVSLTVACDNPLSRTVSVYPITATDWSAKRVDLAVTVGGTSNITIPLTGSPSFLSGTTVPGFFISTPLMTWYDVSNGSVVGGRGSYVTVNSVNLLLNYN